MLEKVCIERSSESDEEKNKHQNPKEEITTEERDYEDDQKESTKNGRKRMKGEYIHERKGRQNRHEKFEKER